MSDPDLYVIMVEGEIANYLRSDEYSIDDALGEADRVDGRVVQYTPGSA